MFQDNNINFSNQNSNEDTQYELINIIDNAPKHAVDNNKIDAVILEEWIFLEKNEDDGTLMQPNLEGRDEFDMHVILANFKQN